MGVFFNGYILKGLEPIASSLHPHYIYGILELIGNSNYSHSNGFAGSQGVSDENIL